ncbi:SWIB/MDM2 domain [Dillenia turbinata]|uniref:SWIB/MDM2 domain n=1 Tax=Dillenia turbinata TaxID=194707 RepID=A0AAN8W3R9_9MAGN
MGRKNFRKMKMEELAEDYCFVCKDGGDLIICDYNHSLSSSAAVRNCLKSYHPGCVEEDNSILEKKKRWNCARHSCYNCQKLARFHCFCCPMSVCKLCINDPDFVQVRGSNGFCSDCLKLALLVEEEKDVDSDGLSTGEEDGSGSIRDEVYLELADLREVKLLVEAVIHKVVREDWGFGKVDFKDRETIEGLFMEYYEIIKKKVGWTIENLRVADRYLKEGRSIKVDSDLDDEDVCYYEDDGDSEEDSPGDRRKRFKRQKVAAERKKPKKMEYIGWGSKHLIEFLRSIGKDTAHELSQYDVNNIINDYVHEKKLIDPVKKRTIHFDEKLYSLFGKKKKKVSRFKINELLDDHFSKNIEHSVDGTNSDDIDSSCDEDKNVFVADSREKKGCSIIKLPKKKVNRNVVENCFASMVASNIKLIYLRRSLVKDLVGQPEIFEEKVVGCFVRVRSDPNDYLQKNSHQLVQVKGIKKSSSTSQINSEVLLQVSHLPTDIPISMLSDDDFSEVELQQKALSVHEVVTKHYLEKRKLLETPAEQSRLLQGVPEVIADVAESEQSSGSSSGKTDASTESIKQAAQHQKEPSPSGILPLGQIPPIEAKPDAVPLK